MALKPRWRKCLIVLGILVVLGAWLGIVGWYKFFREEPQTGLDTPELQFKYGSLGSLRGGVSLKQATSLRSMFDREPSGLYRLICTATRSERTSLTERARWRRRPRRSSHRCG